MEQRISPARRLSGQVLLPGDKSISHRYAMLSAIAEGPISPLQLLEWSGLPLDAAMHALTWSAWTKNGSTVEVEGRGLNGLQAPSETSMPATPDRRFACFPGSSPLSHSRRGSRVMSRSQAVRWSAL